MPIQTAQKTKAISFILMVFITSGRCIFYWLRKIFPMIWAIMVFFSGIGALRETKP